jgi:hypothetical protein
LVLSIVMGGAEEYCLVPTSTGADPVLCAAGFRAETAYQMAAIATTTMMIPTTARMFIRWRSLAERRLDLVERFLSTMVLFPSSGSMDKIIHPKRKNVLIIVLGHWDSA